MKTEKFGDRYDFLKSGKIITNGNRYNGYNRKEMKFQIGKHGYAKICLSDGKSQKTYLVHRLIAEAFIPNPLNHPEVNHKDGIKTNNNVSNLEWVSKKENRIHDYNCPNSNTRNACLKNLEKINSKTRYTKVVIKKDNTIKEFNSTRETAYFLNCSRDKVIISFKKKRICNGYQIISLKRTANGGTQTDNAVGNTVGNIG